MADDKTVVTKKTQAAKSVTKKTVAKASNTASPVSKKTVAKKTAAKKVTTKKAPAKPAVARAANRPPAPPKSPPPKPAAKKTVSKKVAPSLRKPLEEERPVTLTPVAEVSPEERWKMIELAAYYRAERRNFAAGHEQEDWAAAAAEIDELLRKRGG